MYPGFRFAARHSAVLYGLLWLPSVALAQPAVWPRYVIDDELHGADGVRLADADSDGRVDLVVGWEESGRTRAYFHPGYDEVTKPWPRVDIGESPSVEDAVWADLNGDGRLDVLTSCEGRERSLRLHQAPSENSRLLQSEAWHSTVIPCSQGVSRWMFSQPLPATQVDVSAAVVAVGSKQPNGMVALLHAQGPVGRWTLTKLTDAAWIMSLEVVDVDSDGDLDLLYSDRKPTESGVYWLENRTGSLALGAMRWEKHLIGGFGREVMFLAVPTRLKATNRSSRIFAAVKDNLILEFASGDDPRARWVETTIEVQPSERIGFAKGLAVGDLDGDGTDELVYSCESATPPKSGLIYLKRDQAKDSWRMHDIGGPDGIKFDQIELLDLDDDGDLDVLTCEERANKRGLGVVWYANPQRAP